MVKSQCEKKIISENDPMTTMWRQVSNKGLTRYGKFIVYV